MSLDVAIVGGGLSGCLSALAFAERGHHVTIFDRAPALLTRASAANEGKIHLGYTYAADQSFRTAERLVEDALAFRPILERWITGKEFDSCLYDHFRYVIPEDSALSLGQITQHFAKVEDHLRARMAEGHAYLGETEFEPFRPAAEEDSTGRASFLTVERGVWPAGISALIARCAGTHPKIEIRLGARVDRIIAEGTRWRVQFDGTRSPEGPFDIAVNAAWAERRSIDRRSGFASAGSWFTRYKFGVLLKEASTHLAGAIPPNTTATSGPFGDCVYFAQNDTLYSSWYPVGMCYTTMDEDLGMPPQLAERSDEMVRATWAGCEHFAPAFARLAGLASPLPATMIGDFIMAKGQSDIDDPVSGLHHRSTHGATELARGYWSIETGKYTSAPRCAMACVNASLGGD